jgi:hypothetical protein
MKKIKPKFLLIFVLFVLCADIFAAEKAEIRYKNGDVLKCIVEKYEIGKYAVVFDENNNKRLISWDSIAEIVFESNSETPIKTPEPEAAVSEPAVIVPEPEEVPVEIIPEVTEQKEPEKKVETSSGKSMLEQFKAKETKNEETSQQKPKNAAERWAEKQKQDKIESDKEKHKEAIRQENRYQETEVDLDKDTGKLSVEYYQTLESDSERRSWIENGGILKAKGYTVNYTYTSMEMYNTELTMNGFGMTYTGSLKWIKPPSYEEGKNDWGAFSLGGGGSMNLTFGSFETEYEIYDLYTGSYILKSTMDLVNLVYEISGNIGYTFGLGKYLSPEDWKGVMLGIYWKPNFVMNMSTYTITNDYYPDGYTDSSDPTTAFNFTGLQWTIDWGSFGAMADKLAQEAHLSISGFIVPETDETPFMLSIGVGLVWY